MISPRCVRAGREPKAIAPRAVRRKRGPCSWTWVRFDHRRAVGGGDGDGDGVDMDVGGIRASVFQSASFKSPP